MRAPGELAREAASRRSIRLATGEAGLAMARRFVARATVAAGWEDHVDDVALLASELATNAVLHGARPIAVAVEAGGHRLRVEVSDAAPALPVELDLGLRARTGAVWRSLRPWPTNGERSGWPAMARSSGPSCGTTMALSRERGRMAAEPGVPRALAPRRLRRRASPAP